MLLKFHIDPGHGWLEADVSLLREFNVENVTPYSYIDPAKGIVYLEEDLDAGRLIDALEDAEVEYDVTYIDHRDLCFIRELPPVCWS